MNNIQSNYDEKKRLIELYVKNDYNDILYRNICNEIMNGSKGLLEFKVDFEGKSAHSSNPERGINAIEKCISFLEELKLFYNVLKSETDKRFKIPYTTMNIGKIQLTQHWTF